MIEVPDSNVLLSSTEPSQCTRRTQCVEVPLKIGMGQFPVYCHAPIILPEWLIVGLKCSKGNIHIVSDIFDRTDSTRLVVNLPDLPTTLTQAIQHSH